MAYDKQIIELAVTRFSMTPPNISISIGDYGTFTKNELIAEIRQGTPVGQAAVEMQLNAIRIMPTLAHRLSRRA